MANLGRDGRKIDKLPPFEHFAVSPLNIYPRQFARSRRIKNFLGVFIRIFSVFTGFIWNSGSEAILCSALSWFGISYGFSSLEVCSTNQYAHIFGSKSRRNVFFFKDQEENAVLFVG